MLRPVEEVVEDLLDALNDKMASDALVFIREYKEGIHLCNTYIAWIIQPVNLSKLQSAIVEHLGIPHKALMIKIKPNSSRGMRASLFVQAMEICITKAI